jgi:hypothetical protein
MSGPLNLQLASDMMPVTQYRFFPAETFDMRKRLFTLYWPSRDRTPNQFRRTRGLFAYREIHQITNWFCKNEILEFWCTCRIVTHFYILDPFKLKTVETCTLATQKFELDSFLFCFLVCEESPFYMAYRKECDTTQHTLHTECMQCMIN